MKFFEEMTKYIERYLHDRRMLNKYFEEKYDNFLQDKRLNKYYEEKYGNKDTSELVKELEKVSTEHAILHSKDMINTDDEKLQDYYDWHKINWLERTIEGRDEEARYASDNRVSPW